MSGQSVSVMGVQIDLVSLTWHMRSLWASMSILWVQLGPPMLSAFSMSCVVDIERHKPLMTLTVMPGAERPVSFSRAALLLGMLLVKPPILVGLVMAMLSVVTATLILDTLAAGGSGAGGGPGFDASPIRVARLPYFAVVLGSVLVGLVMCEHCVGGPEFDASPIRVVSFSSLAVIVASVFVGVCGV